MATWRLQGAHGPPKALPTCGSVTRPRRRQLLQGSTGSRHPWCLGNPLQNDKNLTHKKLRTDDTLLILWYQTCIPCIIHVEKSTVRRGLYKFTQMLTMLTVMIAVTECLWHDSVFTFYSVVFVPGQRRDCHIIQYILLADSAVILSGSLWLEVNAHVTGCKTSGDWGKLRGVKGLNWISEVESQHISVLVAVINLYLFIWDFDPSHPTT